MYKLGLQERESLQRKKKMRERVKSTATTKSISIEYTPMEHREKNDKIEANEQIDRYLLFFFSLSSLMRHSFCHYSSFTSSSTSRTRVYNIIVASDN